MFISNIRFFLFAISPSILRIYQLLTKR